MRKQSGASQEGAAKNMYLSEMTNKMHVFPKHNQQQDKRTTKSIVHIKPNCKIIQENLQ